MTCPDCGHQNVADRQSCESCGAELADHPETGPTPADPAESPTVLRDSSEMPTVAGGDSIEQTVGPGAAPEETTLQPGHRIGDRYEVQKILGSGGFGAVYKAHDRVLDRTVALKVIRPTLAANPEMIERFKREILLASQITHKNVVRIHDLGEVGDLKFISMAYVDGSDLAAILKRDGPKSVERAIPLIRHIGEALQAAHDAVDSASSHCAIKKGHAFECGLAGRRDLAV